MLCDFHKVSRNFNAERIEAFFETPQNKFAEYRIYSNLLYTLYVEWFMIQTRSMLLTRPILEGFIGSHLSIMVLECISNPANFH